MTNTPKPNEIKPYYYDGKWSIMTKDAEGNPQRVYVDGPDDLPKPGEIYRHHSGTLYEILKPVFDGDTGEQRVVYRALEVRRTQILMEKCLRLTQIGPRYVHTVANFMQPGRFERVKS